MYPVLNYQTVGEAVGKSSKLLFQRGRLLSKLESGMVFSLKIRSRDKKKALQMATAFQVSFLLALTMIY